MMADNQGPERAIIVVGAVSGETLVKTNLPSSATVVDVKRAVQESGDVNRFRLRLLRPSGQLLEDSQPLTGLAGADDCSEPLTLTCWRVSPADPEDSETGQQLLDVAQHGSSGELEQVLGRPAWPDFQDASGSTALQHVSQAGNIEAARFLLEAGADMDKSDQYGSTPLLLATREGHLELVRLLADAGADLDKGYQYGTTPLLMASGRGNVKVARLLCEAGADKERTLQGGATALLVAAAEGQAEIVQLLLAFGANKDAARRDGATGLLLATRKGHTEVVRLLCQAGADASKANRNGTTPLVVATKKGSSEMIRMLLEGGALPQRAPNLVSGVFPNALCLWLLRRGRQPTKSASPSALEKELRRRTPPAPTPASLHGDARKPCSLEEKKPSSPTRKAAAGVSLRSFHFEDGTSLWRASLCGRAPLASARMPVA